MGDRLGPAKRGTGGQRGDETVEERGGGTQLRQTGGIEPGGAHRGKNPSRIAQPSVNRCGDTARVDLRLNTRGGVKKANNKRST